MSKRKIYFNADIVTMDDAMPSADAICVKNGIIEAIGTKDEILSKYPKANTIDMQGKTILPGFIDGHSHIISNALYLIFGNAHPSPQGKCDSVELLIEELSRQFAEWKKTASNKSSFTALGYDNAAFPDKRTITKYDLDKISTDTPIFVMHASGHCTVLNSCALKMCGITDDYVVPNGGGMPKIPGTNEYSGELQENAMSIAIEKQKNIDLSNVFKLIAKSEDMYASYGITTAQDAKVAKPQYTLAILRRLIKPFKLDIIFYLDPSLSKKLPKQDPHKNPYKKHLRYAGYKLILDGSPQAKTAWFTKPYHIVPDDKTDDYCGFPIFTDEELCAHIDKCLKNNWQFNAHTNGDAAIDQLIRCYKKCKAENPNAMDIRPVSIHCQTVREDQLDEIKECGMLISFFCDHVYYWGDYHYSSVLGPERGVRISPMRTAIDRGINCTLHQDSPVVDPNTLFSVHNAVNRVTRNGMVLGEQYKITPYEALKCVTINAAYQIFEEHKKGSLTVGKLADMVVLDKNPLKVPVDTIKDIAVLETIKEGKTIFKR